MSYEQQKFQVVKYQARIEQTEEYKGRFVLQPKICNFTKLQLAQRLEISARDITNLVVLSQTIEARDEGIILAFGDIDAVIRRESMYFFLNNTSNEDFYGSFEELFERIQQGEDTSEISNNFELLCLQACIAYVLGGLRRQVDAVAQTVRAYSDVRKARRLLYQQQVAKCQMELTQIENDAQKACQTLEKLLQDDIEIARLSFQNQRAVQEIRRKQQENISDDELLEQLPIDSELIADIIEAECFRARDILFSTQELKVQVEGLVFNIEFLLDDRRNQLFEFEMNMTCFLLTLDIAAMWFGMWGMNVPIPEQWNKNETYVVLGFVTAFCMAIYIGLQGWTRSSQNKQKRKTITT